MNATIRKDEGPACHGRPLSNATEPQDTEGTDSDAVLVCAQVEVLVCARARIGRMLVIETLRDTPNVDLAEARKTLAHVDGLLARLAQRLDRGAA